MADAPMRSTEAVARARLAQIEPPLARDGAVQPDAPKPTSFTVFTWQVERAPDNSITIYVLGRNLRGARELRIAGATIVLRAAPDGRRAEGPLPPGLASGVPITLVVGDEEAELVEPFSDVKPDGLPKIVSGNLTRVQRVRPTQPGAGTVPALELNLKVEGHHRRGAPVSAFIGPVVIPSSQLRDKPDSIVGVAYDFEGLEEGDPVLVDFGQGLRVLAPFALTADLLR